MFVPFVGISQTEAQYITISHFSRKRWRSKEEKFNNIRIKFYKQILIYISYIREKSIKNYSKITITSTVTLLMCFKYLTNEELHLEKEALVAQRIVRIVLLPSAFLSLLFAFSAVISPLHPAMAAGVIPTQWIAKIYTEGLGRIPDQTGWQNQVAYFQSNGCSAAPLQHQGEQIYLSSEFSGLNYDNPAKLLALYRGALNREPDASGFSANLKALNNGEAWSAMVDQFFTSPEFNTLVSSICSSSSSSYNFGTAPAMPIPTSGTGFAGGTETQLQSLLNSTPSGGTVFLAQKAVVTIDMVDSNGPVPLVIPAGVTLTTTGQPSTGQYALMGRLVRAANFVGGNPNAQIPMVKVSSGARLLNVWVDGQRGVPSNYQKNALNIEIEGGSGTTVSNNRDSNTFGWSNLHALGSKEGAPCASNIIKGNVVTAYSSSHFKNSQGGQQWSDGLSIACENADVEGNQVVDATDVGIVLFRASPAVQKSTVRNNTVLSAGNAAFGGLVADGLTGVNPHPDFTGSSIDHNTLWTGPNTWFQIGLSVGSRAWFGTSSNTGTGASFTFNTTGILTAQVNTGIAVSGMLNATVQNNTLQAIPSSSFGKCPPVAVGASVSAGFASGSIQPYTDVLIQGCV